jgi:multidrug efflux pump subunit AcrA (membrane-fusion protein)
VKVTAADASPGSEHSARVIQMSPVVDPASGSVEILAEFSGAVSDLRPGMQAEVHLAKP